MLMSPPHRNRKGSGMRFDRALVLVGGLVVILVLLAAAPASAQEQVAITGTVTGSDGTPQAGATVTVEQTGVAALTDEQGRYALSM